MKLYHKNPRQITERQFKDLQESLDELGDLSGIVHDLNSDEVISGNQRSRVFDINECEITVEHEQEADRQGTVGLGHIVWRGTFYAYRQVRWTPKQCEMANIKANKLGGEWDFDKLANEFELDELLEWGFEPFELGLDDSEPDEPAEQEQARQTLAERFVVPPFSVLDARQGYWQERKRAWLALGIQSELGRGDTVKTTGGGSIMPACDYGTSGERSMRGG